MDTEPPVGRWREGYAGVSRATRCPPRSPSARAGRRGGTPGGRSSARRASTRSARAPGCRVPTSIALQGARAAGGGRPDGLCRRHPHRGHGEGDHDRHVRREARAGVAVGGERDRRSRVERARAHPARASASRGRRQGRASRRRRRRPAPPRRLGKVGEMVGARRAELGGESRARARLQLVGVDPEAEPLVFGRGEDRARLILVERATLAEDVRPPGKRRAGIEHRRREPGRRSRRARRRTPAPRRDRRGTSRRR